MGRHAPRGSSCRQARWPPCSKPGRFSQALRTFVDDLTLTISTVFVDRAVHEAAMSGVLGAQLRQLSLVDMVSFEVMRRAGVRAAFAFDEHFARFGFDVQPG